MPVQDGLHDVKAEAEAVFIDAAGGIGLVKPVENKGKVFLGDAAAGIVDLHARLVAGFFQGQAQRAALKRVFDGVVDEIV